MAGARGAGVWLAAVGLLFGCASATTTTEPDPPAAARAALPIDDEVSAWLDRAASAPHNGMNPQLELPPRIVSEGADALQRAITSGAAARRRDAAFALSRHPEPATLRPFWRAQLESDEPDIRFRAVTTLAAVHDAADLEPVLRAYLAHADLHHALAVRLRDWRDRRTVVALIELLDAPSPVAQNAAESLAQSPGVPSLDAEATTTDGATHTAEGAWRAAPSSRVAPYRRWWDERGRADFAPECAWWADLAGAARPVCEPR